MNTIRLRIDEDMDAAGMVRLKPIFEELGRATSAVELDLGSVTFIDSSGVGGLVFLYKRLAARGLGLTVVRLEGQPRQLLEHLAVARVLTASRDGAAA
jgi:anti-anti-sigma factor